MSKLRKKDPILGRFAVTATALLLVAVDADAAAIVPVPAGLDNNVDARHVSHEQPRRLEESTATPAQAYYVPLRENDLLASFQRIAGSSSSPSNFNDKTIHSLTALSLAVEGTVIWYDHWEDGYERDVTIPSQSSTKIYGDGKWQNGCFEAIKAAMDDNNYSYNCTDNDDIIPGGEALIFDNQNGVQGDRTAPYEILHDGGDLIRSSFPIAMARGAYPQEEGSLLAGAVEIGEAETYGTTFHVPVGSNTDNRRFEMSELHLMARFSNTDVYVKSGPDDTETFRGTIQEGGTLLLSVNEGYIIRTTKTVQASLLTGDIESGFEMRWYALLPVEQWSNEYYTPVSDDGRDSTTIYMYNPDADSIITVTHEDKNGLVRTVDISPGDTGTSVTKPDTGNKVYTSGGEPFFALTVTDNGILYDWGHPLIPSSMLTSQALVGMGYGCTDNNCGSSSPKSLVWVTPVSAATIYVDSDGDGTVDDSQVTSALGQYRVEKTTGDKDLTGAIIYATDSNGDPVDIAAAWGQVPSRSGSSDNKALDMGTVIMPLPELAAYKEAELKEDRDGDGNYSPGDIMLYTIRITNSGQIDLAAGNFDVIDDLYPLFEQTTYVQNSAIYYDQNKRPYNISDNDAPDDSEFPLDGQGVTNPVGLPTGSAHSIQFEVEIKPVDDPDEGLRLCLDSVTNTGRLSHNVGDLTDDFSVTTPLFFSGSIDVVVTVYPGHDNGAACDAGNTGSTTLEGLVNASITYCYVVTNTGNTYVNETVLEDSLTNVLDEGSGELLAPGDSTTLHYETVITSSMTNAASVNANARLFCSEADVGGTLSNTSGVNVTILMLESSYPTTHPVASPTSSPSASPTSSPTSLPSASPTSSPTETVGIDISTIDQCMNFSQFFEFGTYMEHFAFLARTTECVNAKVYVNDRPLTQEEVDSGLLDVDWELMCDADVQGRGAREHTYIPSDNCTTIEVPAGGRMHFYITMDYIDGARCDGLGGGGGVGSFYDTLYSVFTVQNDVCPM